MATLFFGVKGATLDLRQDLQIADTDAPRIIGYLMQSEHGRISEEVSTPDASWVPNKALGTTEADRPVTRSIVTRQATPEETAANYARFILADLLSKAVQHERQMAMTAAAESVLPIEVIG
jgi:hypothetical protein